jgi:predicted glycoside hydrolase/deacetylase ChbG (UPF0249 family)
LGAVALALLASSAHAQEAGPQPDRRTWAERLGWAKGSRVLILHADDVGMCWEANASTERYLEQGDIQSAAAMVPCPWFEDFARWAKANPKHDVGLHLTLTSEWKTYRWGPVAPREQVSSLLDDEGFLHRTVPAVVLKARPEEVEAEIRAQVERSLELGLRPSHLDTHMGTLYAHTPFTRAYLKVAVDYGIPAMVIELTPKRIAKFRALGYPLPKSMLRLLEDYPLPRLDDFQAAPKATSYDDFKAKFSAQVKALEPGITEVVFHPSDDTPGLARITNSHRQRGWEARLFSDPDVKALLRSEGIQFTNWKEMMARWKARGKSRPPRLASPRGGKRFFK